MVEPCDDCESGAMPMAEVDMESPSYDPASEMSSPATQPMRTQPRWQPTRVVTGDADDAVRWTTPPSTMPVASNVNGTATPSTQPAMTVFGMRGLGAAMAEMMKKDMESKNQPKESTVTELPTEELPDDNK